MLGRGQLLGELRRWGLAREAVDELLPHADRAIDWIDFAVIGETRDAARREDSAVSAGTAAPMPRAGESELRAENRRLRRRVTELEAGGEDY